MFYYPDPALEAACLKDTLDSCCLFLGCVEARALLRKRNEKGSLHRSEKSPKVLKGLEPQTKSWAASSFTWETYGHGGPCVFTDRFSMNGQLCALFGGRGGGWGGGGVLWPNNVHKLWKRCSLGILPHKKSQESKVSIYMGLECKRKGKHLSKCIISESVWQTNRKYLENKRNDMLSLTSVKSWQCKYFERRTCTRNVSAKGRMWIAGRGQTWPSSCLCWC